MRKVPCSIEDCDAAIHARGFCLHHYKADYYRRNIERHKQRMAAWRADNLEAVRAQDAARYARDAEALKVKASAWRAANPEKKRASNASWLKANPERRQMLDAAYQERNAEEIKARRSAYTRANREKARQANARRRALKRGSQTEPVRYDAILSKWGMVCHLCGTTIADRAELHFDHVIPLARGGAHAEHNIRPSHAFCNQSKGARLGG